MWITLCSIGAVACVAFGGAVGWLLCSERMQRVVPIRDQSEVFNDGGYPYP